MTKRRDALSWPGAVRRAIELVGAERIAAELQSHGARIRVQAVYEWSDPDSGSQPVFWQGEVIDALCGKRANERPFSAVWNARTSAPEPTGACPRALAVEANGYMASLLHEMNLALEDSQICEAERTRLNAIMALLVKATGAVNAEVNATVTTPREAGR